MNSDQNSVKTAASNYAIVGLGNVGAKYQGSRHNIGFAIVDELAQRLKLEFSPGKGDYFAADGANPAKLSWIARLFGKKSDQASQSPALLIKPTTYMNASGKAVRQVSAGYQVQLQRILIVTDDFQLPLGTVRLRQSGSDGGHNGLASIIREFESEDFPRLRIGIGPRPQKEGIIDFVLSQFDPAEQSLVKTTVDHAVLACLHLLGSKSENPLAQTMSKYNIVHPDPAPGSGAADASK